MICILYYRCQIRYGYPTTKLPVIATFLLVKLYLFGQGLHISLVKVCVVVHTWMCEIHRLAKVEQIDPSARRRSLKSNNLSKGYFTSWRLKRCRTWKAVVI